MTALKTKDEQLDDAMEIIRQKNSEITRQAQTIKQIRRENDTAEAIRQEIWGLAARPPRIAPWVGGHGIKHGTRGGPLLMLSDVHYGETINPDEVAGVNEYNRTIAKRRIKRLVDTTIDLCFNHMGRANVAYPGIVVCLGGDLVGGDIHEELMATNDRTPQQAVNELTDILGSAIETLATKFGRIVVPSVVGNHGRTTKRSRMKGRVFHNYDWSIACNLEREFRRDKKHIQILSSNEADYFFEMFGHRFLLTHGDDLGTHGGDGIIGALGPIMRGRMKISNSQAELGRDFDTLLIGHYHQYIALDGLICNNSIKGYDEYANIKLRAKYKRPSQALTFVHPEHGITANWQVYLEGRKHAQQSKVWTQWLA